MGPVPTVSTVFLLLSLSLCVLSLPSPSPDSYHPSSNYGPASTFPLVRFRDRKEGRKIVRLRQKVSDTGDGQDYFKAAKTTEENLRVFQPHFEDLEPFKPEVEEIVTVEETDNEEKDVTEGVSDVETTDIYEIEIDPVNNEIIAEEVVEARSDLGRIEKSLVGTFPSYVGQQLGDISLDEENSHHDFQGGHHRHRPHGQVDNHRTHHGHNQHGDEFVYEDPSNHVDTKKFE